MSEMKQRDLLTKLADAGEGAISRVAGHQATARMDDLQKKLRGLDELEQRVTKLEKTVADLSKPKKTTPRPKSSTAARKPAEEIPATV